MGSFSNCSNFTFNALSQNRLDDYNVDLAAITNISQDHLDRHNTMKEYIQLKIDLTKNLNKEGYIIYNRDDNELHKALKNNLNQKETFSITRKDTLFYLNNNKCHLLFFYLKLNFSNCYMESQIA